MTPLEEWLSFAAFCVAAFLAAARCGWMGFSLSVRVIPPAKRKQEGPDAVQAAAVQEIRRGA